jgi:phosphatidylinositol glycan class B
VVAESRWDSFVGRWRALSLALIVLAAARSNGFHHPDEHFQTLEFAASKLGRADVHDLPWEYAFRMRGWLQPGLYVLEARLLTALGLSDPLTWAFGFRLTSGLLAWVAMGALIRCLPTWLPDAAQSRLAVKALCLAWFIPYLSVRTSSESLAGSLLVLGLATLTRARRPEPGAIVLPSVRALLVSGLLLGAAFEMRYAVGIAIASLLAWAVVMDRVPVRRMLWAAAGVLSAIGVGTVVDRWGYGDWTSPALHYFFQNLVAGRAAERFGVLPWYGYFWLAATGPAAPLVLLVMAGCIVGWLRWPRHVLTWTTAPFVVVHALIAHKELRFLFPLALLAPVLIVLALVPAVPPMAWLTRLRHALHGPSGRVLLGANLVALAAFSLIPTQPQLWFQRFVRERYPSSFDAYLLRASSPWILNTLVMSFYRPDALALHPVVDLEAIPARRFVLITGGCDLPDPRVSCALVYRNVPCWVRSVFDRQRRLPAWDLYECARLSARGAAADARIAAGAPRSSGRPCRPPAGSASTPRVGGCGSGWALLPVESHAPTPGRRSRRGPRSL